MVTGTLNGFGFAQWAKSEREGLQVILSGSIASAADAPAELCENGPRLSRPYDPQSVADYIKRLLAKRDG